VYGRFLSCHNLSYVTSRTGAATLNVVYVVLNLFYKMSSISLSLTFQFLDLPLWKKSQCIYMPSVRVKGQILLLVLA
jgi:hypothetical protein